jgi:hypothetical protein
MKAEAENEFEPLHHRIGNGLLGLRGACVRVGWKGVGGGLGWVRIFYDGRRCFLVLAAEMSSQKQQLD